jgi:hypothetical protein
MTGVQQLLAVTVTTSCHASLDAKSCSSCDWHVEFVTGWLLLSLFVPLWRWLEATWCQFCPAMPPNLLLPCVGADPVPTV